MYKFPEKFTGTNCEYLDFKEFKSLCYGIESYNVAKVVEIKEHDFPNNYYEAYLDDGPGVFSIVMNCFVREYGFRILKGDNTYYLDKLEISDAVKLINPKLTYISAGILEQTAKLENLDDLTDHEVKEVKYWFPANIGSLLFSSYFD
jgi:hypothetical protein